MSTTESIVTNAKAETDGLRVISYPVGASTKILKGTYCKVGFDGYLYDGGSANQAKRVVIADEEIDNGSGSAGAKSAKCLDSGRFVAAATSITQASVGQVAYLVDNNTVDDTFTTGGTAVGIICRYISATQCEVLLNDFGQGGGTVTVKAALTAAGTNAGGGVLNLLNPLGMDCMVENIVLKVTTAPTDTAGGVDVGIAATGTSSDVLIDGLVLAAAGYYSCNNSAGTNGGADRKLGAAQYITATSSVSSHYDLAAMVGQAIITLRVI